MTQQFFAGTSGDPASLVREFYFQSLDGVAALDANLVPYKNFGGILSPRPTSIRRQSVLTRPMRELDMRSKAETDGRSLHLGDLDPSNHMQLAMWISLLQGYSLATASGHTRWRISQEMADVGTAVYNKITHINDSNKGIPIRHTDLIARSVELAIAPRENASLIFGVEAGRFDFWGVPTRTTGTGLVLPQLRGTSSENWLPDATDGVVFIKIMSDSATIVTFQAKVATAGSYSSTQTATKGEWCYVYTGASSTVPLGGRAAQVEVYFPTGIDGSFVDADIFEFPKRRLLAVVPADYPTPRPVAETQFRFLLDGVSVYADGGVTINVDVPNATTRYVAGGEQPIGTDRFGQHDVTVTIDRRMVDLDLQKALMTADTVSLVAEGRNDTIVGASLKYWGTAVVLPYLSLEGTMHDADVGAANKDEVMTLRAFRPESSFTYEDLTDIDADIEVIVDTDIIAADLGL